MPSKFSSVCYFCKNASKSAVNWSLWVAKTPCGAPSYSIQFGVGNAGSGGAARRVNGNRIVGGSMDDKRRDRKRGEIGTKVGRGERFGAGQSCLQAGLHRDISRGFQNFVADRVLDNPHPVEVFEEGREEMRPIRLHARRHFGEHWGGNAVWITVSLEHVRDDGGDERGLRHVFSAVARKVTGNFAAAHRKTDDGGIGRARRFDHRRQIVGKRIVVVAIPRLIGATEAASVVRNRAKAPLRPAVPLHRPNCRRKGASRESKSRGDLCPNPSRTLWCCRVS